MEDQTSILTHQAQSDHEQEICTTNNKASSHQVTRWLTLDTLSTAVSRQQA